MKRLKELISNFNTEDTITQLIIIHPVDLPKAERWLKSKGAEYTVIGRDEGTVAIYLENDGIELINGLAAIGVRDVTGKFVGESKKKKRRRKTEIDFFW